MNYEVFLWSAMWTIMPIAELRVGLPTALIGGIPLPVSFIYCVLINALVSPLVFLFLSTLHKLLIKWAFYANFFEKIVKKARIKIEKKVNKYGYLGLAFFVGIPLPVTGAYTGAIGAWVLGLEKKKTFIAIFLGLIISATIVTLAYYGVTLLGLEFLKIFYRV
jgi:uncharacterized membrane protein